MAKKKRQLKRLPAAERARILTEARTKGMTAEQVQKKYGVSKWTFYGWRKRTPKTKGAVGRVATVAVNEQALRNELRAVLPGILREELARALGGVFGGAGARRRSRR